MAECGDNLATETIQSKNIKAMEKLTKEEIGLQAKTQIQDLMARMAETAIANVDKAPASGAVPEHWSKEGDCRLAKAIVDALCSEHPYGGGSKQDKKDAANLALFL